MASLALYDTVTLSHFGAAGRMDLLKIRHGHFDLPRWTRAVADEITTGQGIPECDKVLAAKDWLGDPQEPETSDLKGILQLQIGLSDGKRPPTEHLGEAESIYMADKLNGIFITDDNAAYDFASRKLGPARVIDTIDFLRECVAFGDLDESKAHQIVHAIRNSNRAIRRVHPITLPSSYFS